ncbi:MAG: L-rhamnose mutarotase [Segetibacter sp.]|nr:L-rhamnose mutarotase [Segetibacter sp.]
MRIPMYGEATPVPAGSSARATGVAMTTVVGLQRNFRKFKHVDINTPSMKRYCLALDLADDAGLITEYERLHKTDNVRPEIRKSILDAGITNMEIFRTANRLFMIMETNDSFSFERKAEMDAANPAVQEWEQFVWKFQQPLPWAKEGEKWVLMDQIFQL